MGRSVCKVMYLKKIKDVNIGPIKEASIAFPFKNNGEPKPVVIVGENGTGKSALLSNIVDGLYEIAGEAFSNARQPADTEGYEFYKAISPTEIHLGQSYMYSYAEFEDSNCKPTKVEYIFKSGHLAPDQFKVNSGVDLDQSIIWQINDNYKKAVISKESAELIFSKDVLCYFGPERYEKPSWMGDRYYRLSDFEHPAVRNKLARKLENPISVNDMTTSTLQWILDVIVDSRCDIAQNGTGFNIANVEVSDLLQLGIARSNIEAIMSKVLGTDVYFGLNFRNTHGSRFNVCSKQDNSILVPTLDALSTGQSALFNMFATIVRYADQNDINESIRLSDISGIVIIDEIELHLHTNLQREVLPQLISLFPKVQFIVSTHSPLFLLGMEQQFGEEGYKIYQMPSAEQITAERFSEFQKAYNYLSQTQTYQHEMQVAIASHQSKPLIITEGATDWKHLKTAFNHIMSDPTIATKYQDLDFDFLEYEPKNSKQENSLKLEMSNSQLKEMCKNCSAFPQLRKLIFVADADDAATTKELGGDDNCAYKSWGNDVYSFVLPVPPHRVETPNICIEHYYTDNEIKTFVQIDGINRRIFMGNEFDEVGISLDKELLCYDRNSCGEKKIRIIDGTSDKRVIKINDPEKHNLALAKMEFAISVFNGDGSFLHFNFSTFQLVFDIIKEILL